MMELIFAFIGGFVLATLLFRGKKTRTVGDGTSADKQVMQPLPDHVMTLVEAELRKSNKIEAIKIYRENTGVGLKDSKDVVEIIHENMKRANG